MFRKLTLSRVEGCLFPRLPPLFALPAAVMPVPEKRHVFFLCRAPSASMPRQRVSVRSVRRSRFERHEKAPFIS